MLEAHQNGLKNAIALPHHPDHEIQKNALAGIEQQVYSAFREIEKHSSFEILAMGIEHGNHVHIAIKTPPQFSVSGRVSRLKGYSLKHPVGF